MTANVGACAVAGIGALKKNVRQRNDLPDLPRIVSRHKTFFEKLNYKLTPRPAMFTYILLAVVGLRP